jgi:hypothetical protein
MALSNYEKQKRWREKHRALYNFQQRQRRKKVEEEPPEENTPVEKKSKIEELRAVIEREHNREVEVEEPERKPLVFRDHLGNVITERAWNILQKKKAAAKDGGYELDAYIQ